MRSPGLALLPLFPLALSACARNAFDGPLTDLVEHDLGRVNDSDRARLAQANTRALIAAGSESDRNSTSSGQDERSLRDSLLDHADVDEFVALALDRNPGVHAAREQVERLRERLPQVKSLEDPMLQIAPVGEMSETAAGEVNVMSSISQKLPFPGKLSTRAEIVERDIAVSEQRLRQVRLTVAGDTRRAYWGLYDAARAIEITRHSRSLLSQFRTAVDANYRAGMATQEDVLRATIELGEVDQRLIALDQQRGSAVAMLNSLLDRPAGAPIADPPPVALRGFGAKLDTLLALAVDRNPALQAVREELDRFRAERALARLNRYPDLTLSFTYNLVDDSGLAPNATGDNQWWIGLGFNLPIWQARLNAAEREATRGAIESAHRLADEQNRLAFRVQDALLRVQSQRRLASLIRDDIVPQAKQALDAALVSYRAGDADFLTVIDLWRRLLDFELLGERSLVDLEQSFATLQESVGADLDSAGGAIPAPPITISPSAPDASPETLP